ncbi:MAG: hypothetical protein Ct9H300mP23_04500 [Nitrospinota bacterium]|nr:MAG: hypothetical protein Ct9H300mP23_04500 [Nitrospinota bacterium]
MALSQSPYLKKLQQLNVNGNSIDKKGFQLIAKSENFKNLKVLKISGVSMGDEGFQSIINSNSLKQLGKVGDCRKFYFKKESIEAGKIYPTPPTEKARPSRNSLLDPTNYFPFPRPLSLAT